MAIFNASLPAGEECELKLSVGVNLAGAVAQWRLYSLATNEDVIAATLGDGIDILSAADGVLGVTFDTTGLVGSYGHECTVDGQNIVTGVLTVE